MKNYSFTSCKLYNFKISIHSDKVIFYCNNSRLNTNSINLFFSDNESGQSIEKYFNKLEPTGILENAYYGLSQEFIYSVKHRDFKISSLD